jgi:hypothetical protein
MPFDVVVDPVADVVNFAVNLVEQIAVALMVTVVFASSPFHSDKHGD